MLIEHNTSVSPSHDVSASVQRADVDCSIAATVSIIGDRWTLLILRDAFRGIRRFDEFHHDLGIARNLLTNRLARLVAAGIMDKVAYQSRPERFEYRLTRKGIELSPSLVALMKWGDAWMVGDGGPPVVLVHDSCGTPVEQLFHCPSCESHVAPLHLRNREQFADQHADQHGDQTKDAQ
jgi:DNA-binding HxlR family transcriptional regulator